MTVTWIKVGTVGANEELWREFRNIWKNQQDMSGAGFRMEMERKTEEIMATLFHLGNLYHSVK